MLQKYNGIMAEAIPQKSRMLMMKHKKKALLRWVAAPVVAALMLSACATPTPYQPRVRGATVSGGYSEQRLEENRYRVMFTGNSLTSRERVENYLLYRAAELTKQAGYDGFTIVARATDPHSYTTGYRTGPFGYWTPYWRYRYGGFWHSWDPWGRDPFWGDTIDIQTVTNYEASAEIVMSRGRRPNDPMSFDADEVLRNLGPTIQLPERR
jgi:hypothetical protein